MNHRGIALSVAVVVAATGCGGSNEPTTASPASAAPVSAAATSVTADVSISGAESAIDLELIAAAWNNDVAKARDLIARGASVNAKDHTKQNAFHIATSEGYVELLDLALANGADVSILDSFNGTGLIRASHRGHVEIIERLLKTTIDVNHVNGLGWTALLEAVILGDGSDRYVKTVTLLLAAGADKSISDGNGQTPLDHAKAKGQAAIAALLER